MAFTGSKRRMRRAAAMQLTLASQLRLLLSRCSCIVPVAIQPKDWIAVVKTGTAMRGHDAILRKTCLSSGLLRLL